MEGDRDDQPPLAGLDDAVVIEDEIAGRIENTLWLRPGRAIVVRNSQVGPIVEPFVPIDEISRKNVGHDVANLKKHKIWSIPLTSEELAKHSSSNEESYVDQFRRRFAAENGVNVSQVMISIVGQPK